MRVCYKPLCFRTLPGRRIGLNYKDPDFSRRLRIGSVDQNSADYDPTENDLQFSTAFALIREAIAARAFPAASIAITHAGQVTLKAFGQFTYDEESRAVTPVTLFDLASLTKVVATTSMAMILYERGMLDLDAPVVGIVPEFANSVDRDGRRDLVSLKMLLAHSSGLPAHEKFFLKTRNRQELLQMAFTTLLTAEPGSRSEYSDIGFMVLGEALERIAEEPLDEFCQREIFGPLAMAHTTFAPPAEIRGQIPPTQDDQTFRKRIIQGEVHDENVSVMGGVAPHAGLFSTAEDIARFAHAMLRGDPAIVRPETIALFTHRQDAPAGTSRALGWDTPSEPSLSGKYFSARGFGHVGFTGTSLWIDPARQLSVVLLTNRTWPDGSNRAIRQVWPRFHDAVGEALASAA